MRSEFRCGSEPFAAFARGREVGVPLTLERASATFEREELLVRDRRQTLPRSRRRADLDALVPPQVIDDLHGWTGQITVGSVPDTPAAHGADDVAGRPARQPRGTTQHTPLRHRRDVTPSLRRQSAWRTTSCSAPSSAVSVRYVCSGCRRRSVGEPGFRSRSPPGVVVSHGMWLCPKISTSASANVRSIRRSRDFASPVSWITATSSPSLRRRATSGSRERRSGPSLLPHTPRTSPWVRSSSRTVASTQSPACTMRSAASAACSTAAGSIRARPGMCVSEITSILVVILPG